MWRVPTPAGEADLENAEILSVARDSRQIRITLDRVSVAAPGQVSRLSNVTLVCEEVREEEALHYVGPGTLGEIQDTDVPLDVIMVVEFSEGELQLKGYKKREPWYVWRIACGSVKLEGVDGGSAT